MVQVWTETIQGGCPNFITGAGGFLQSVVFGLTGLRLVDAGLVAKPPPMVGNITAVELTSFWFQVNLILFSLQIVVAFILFFFFHLCFFLFSSFLFLFLFRFSFFFFFFSPGWLFDSRERGCACECRRRRWRLSCEREAPLPLC